jgi:hypothetical protein
MHSYPPTECLVRLRITLVLLFPLRVRTVFLLYNHGDKRLVGSISGHFMQYKEDHCHALDPLQSVRSFQLLPIPSKNYG